MVNPLRDKQALSGPFSAANNNGTAQFSPSTTSANTLFLDTTSSHLNTTVPSLDTRPLSLDTTSFHLNTTVPSLDTRPLSLHTTALSLDTTTPCLDTIMPSLDTITPSLDTIVPSLDTSPPSLDTPPDMSFLESLLQPNSVSTESSRLSTSPASSFMTSPSPNSVASFGVPSQDIFSLTHEIFPLQSNTDDVMIQSHGLLPTDEIMPLSYNEASLSNMRPNSSSSDEGCLLDSSSNASPNTFSTAGSITCNSVLSELDLGYQSDFVPSVSSATPQRYCNTSSPYTPVPNLSPGVFSSRSLYSSSTCKSHAVYSELSAPLPTWNSELRHVSYSQGMNMVPSSANQGCPPIDSLSFFHYSTTS